MASAMDKHEDDSQFFDELEADAQFFDELEVDSQFFDELVEVNPQLLDESELLAQKLIRFVFSIDRIIAVRVIGSGGVFAYCFAWREEVAPAFGQFADWRRLPPSLENIPKLKIAAFWRRWDPEGKRATWPVGHGFVVGDGKRTAEYKDGKFISLIKCPPGVLVPEVLLADCSAVEFMQQQPEVAKDSVQHPVTPPRSKKRKAKANKRKAEHVAEPVTKPEAVVEPVVAASVNGAHAMLDAKTPREAQAQDEEP